MKRKGTGKKGKQLKEVFEMEIIPAIDIMGGKCVRLKRGEKKEVTVYPLSPEDYARKWEAEGARTLHVVDLDGAFTGTMENLEAIGRIIKNTCANIQVGGGIRTIETAKKIIGMGAERVIVSTAALSGEKNAEKMFSECKGKIMVSLDCRNWMAATEGWVKKSKISAIEGVKIAEEMGACGIVVTDVSKDGALCGMNLKLIETIAEVSSIPVIASGGVSSLKDLEAIGKTGVEGVIVGKALYEGKVNLREAIALEKTGNDAVKIPSETGRKNSLWEG